MEHLRENELEELTFLDYLVRSATSAHSTRKYTWFFGVTVLYSLTPDLPPFIPGYSCGNRARPAQSHLGAPEFDIASDIVGVGFVFNSSPTNKNGRHSK
jgi:hypothetical protein